MKQIDVINKKLFIDTPLTLEFICLSKRRSTTLEKFPSISKAAAFFLAYRQELIGTSIVYQTIFDNINVSVV